MKTYITEVDSNFDNFFNSSVDNISRVVTKMSQDKEVFKHSYRRIVSFQAWKSQLIEKNISTPALDFFKESQNDLLMSHTLARQGAWRVALMSLRSCIENTLFFLYYSDHPIELRLWEDGKHKLGFTEVLNYLLKHPDFVIFSEQETGLEGIKSEYATLSKAVHASSKLFRVTKGGNIEGLNTDSKADLGAWACRENVTLINLNKILLTFFKDNLSGAALSNLRKAVSLAIPEKYHPQIKARMKISLKKQPPPE